VEAPHLKSLHEKYAAKGLRIVAVNAWDEPKAKVEKFAKDQGLPYTILMNGRTTFRGQYKGSSIPQNYLLDREGNVVLSLLGWDAKGHEMLEGKIKTLLE
jgi:thiol-disulfide isomerase/thioredoxin